MRIMLLLFLVACGGSAEAEPCDTASLHAPVAPVSGICAVHGTDTHGQRFDFYWDPTKYYSDVTKKDLVAISCAYPGSLEQP